MAKKIFVLSATFLCILAILMTSFATVYAKADAVKFITGGEVFAPRGMFFDQTGNRIIFADSDAGVIRAVDLKTFKTTLIAGGEYGLGTDGLPLKGYVDGATDKALFDTPTDVVMLKNGAIIVADSGNHSVRQIYKGKVITIAGGKQEGDKEGKQGSAQFSYPISLAVDAQDNIYVCDSENNKIKKIARDGQVTTVVKGLSKPVGIAVAKDILYVTEADTNDVLRIPISTYKPERIAGSERGYLDGDSKSAKFFAPSGIIVHESDIYVADTGNHVIRKISNGGSGLVCDTLDLGTLNAPKGLVMANGKLYVADTDNRRIIVENKKTTQKSKQDYPACEVPDSADIYIDGFKLGYLDVRPFIIDGTTYIPLRILIESIGGTVEWNADERASVCTYGERSITITEKDYLIRDNRSFIPLRRVVEYLGMEVNWIADKRVIEINTDR